MLIFDFLLNDSGFGLMVLLNVCILIKIDFLVGELSGLLRNDENIIKEYVYIFLCILKLKILKKNKIKEIRKFGKSLILLFLVLLLKCFEDLWFVE